MEVYHQLSLMDETDGMNEEKESRCLRDQKDAISAVVVTKEFYALEALQLVVSRGDPFLHSHQRLMQDIEEYKQLFEEKLAQALWDYTVLVCAGEARHAGARANKMLKDIECSHSRRTAYWEALEFEPVSLLRACARLFKEAEWRNGYGGEPWARIAKAGLLRDEMSRTMWIDTMLHQQHCNNIYLDKLETGIFKIDVGGLRQFQTLKASLPDVHLLPWLIPGTPTFRRLRERAVNLGLLPPRKTPELPQKHEWSWCMCYVLDWALGYTEQGHISSEEWESEWQRLWWKLDFEGAIEQFQEHVQKLLEYKPLAWGSRVCSAKLERTALYECYNCKSLTDYKCAECHDPACEECGTECISCDTFLCLEHATQCAICEDGFYCGSCIYICDSCGTALCSEHYVLCVGCDSVFCEDCAANQCEVCADVFCYKCEAKRLLYCQECGMQVCQDCNESGHHDCEQGNEDENNEEGEEF